MDWGAAKDLVLGALGTAFFGFFMRELHELRKSIEHLNEKIGTVLERTSFHERTLSEHSNRITYLERNEAS